MMMVMMMSSPCSNSQQHFTGRRVRKRDCRRRHLLAVCSSSRRSNQQLLAAGDIQARFEGLNLKMFYVPRLRQDGNGRPLIIFGAERATNCGGCRPNDAVLHEPE